MITKLVIRSVKDTVQKADGITKTNIINSAGKRDRLGVLFPSDKLPFTNRPQAAAEGSGLRPLSYPRNERGPLPKAAARAPLGFAAL